MCQMSELGTDFIGILIFISVLVWKSNNLLFEQLNRCAILTYVQTLVLYKLFALKINQVHILCLKVKKVDEVKNMLVFICLC